MAYDHIMKQAKSQATQ